jgi:class 3 adenylate cyclase
MAKLTDRVGLWPRRSAARIDQKPVSRRLAAILAADVVGYSRLMGADELGTHRLLMAHRSALIDPGIAAHRGRIVKTTGDGVLAEFASAVDAVACAVTIQRGLALPDNKRLQFRIGINIGDVIIEGEDIYGDGVNVAARLEGICEPGGLCISRAVRDQIRDKLPIVFDDLGEQLVKNIARPVHAFGLSPQAIAAAPEFGSALPQRAIFRRRHWIAAVLAGLIVAAGATAWRVVEISSTLRAPPITAARASIAVLPLTQRAQMAAVTISPMGLPKTLSPRSGAFAI